MIPSHSSLRRGSVRVNWYRIQPPGLGFAPEKKQDGCRTSDAGGLHESERDGISHDAVRVVNATDLAEAILKLFADQNERQALGRRGLQILQAQQGATAITLQRLKALLSPRELEAHTD